MLIPQRLSARRLSSLRDKRKASMKKPNHRFLAEKYSEASVIRNKRADNQKDLQIGRLKETSVRITGKNEGAQKEKEKKIYDERRMQKNGDTFEALRKKKLRGRILLISES